MKQALLLSLLFIWGEKFIAPDIHPLPPDPALTIDTLFTAVTTNSEQIHIGISNPGEQNREFIVDIVTVETDDAYWGTILSAAINEDAYFFKQWRQARKLAEKMNIRYILPGYGKIHHGIEADEAIDLNFTIAGQPINKGMPVRLRVTTTDDNASIYSPVFHLYKLPE